MERDYRRGNAGAAMERGMVKNGDWQRWRFVSASKDVACASLVNRWSSLVVGISLFIPIIVLVPTLDLLKIWKYCSPKLFDLAAWLPR